MKPSPRNYAKLFLHSLLHLFGGHRRTTVWSVKLMSPPVWTKTGIYCECGFGKETSNVD